MIDRRMMLVLPLALISACKGGATGGAAGSGDLEAQADMHLGDPKAKVKMTEYHSVACPYCYMFATTIWPDFKKKYIDTGRVYYTSREALTHDPSVAAAGFLIAHCAVKYTGGGDAKYFAVVDTLYRRRYDLFDRQEVVVPNVREVLLDIARSAGLTEAQFNECVNDEKALELIQKRWDAYGKGESKAGTPTIIIGGKQVEPTMAALEAAVAAAEK